MEKWPELISFTHPHEAHLVKGYLASNGIETIIQDELTAQVANYYSAAIGGVKLLVRDTDYDNGISLLKKGGYLSDEDTRSLRETEVVILDKTTNQEICPFCHSDNILVHSKPVGFAAILMVIINLIFLLGSAVPRSTASYQCYDCNREWVFKKRKKTT